MQEDENHSTLPIHKEPSADDQARIAAVVKRIDEQSLGDIVNTARGARLVHEELGKDDIALSQRSVEQALSDIAEGALRVADMEKANSKHFAAERLPNELAKATLNAIAEDLGIREAKGVEREQSAGRAA